MHRCEREVKRILKKIAHHFRKDGLIYEVEIDENGTVTIRSLDDGKELRLRVPRECVTLLVNTLKLSPALPLPSPGGRRRRSRRCRSRRDSAKHLKTECC